MLDMTGQLMGGIFGINKGNAEARMQESQARMAKLNAQQQLAQAEDISARGRQQASDQRQEANQIASSMVAASGASGTDTYAGSANLLYNDAENMEESAIARLMAEVAAERQKANDAYVASMNEANKYQYAAKQARRGGRNSLFKGILGAATVAAKYEKWRVKGW